MDIQAGGLSGNLIQAFVIIFILLISLSVHEFAHAFVANLFGDPTARLEGRLTLNPVRHWDPIGTTMLTALFFVNYVITPTPVFGWGKPVPIDERNFNNPKIYGIQTALAGPMSNLVLAGILALILRTTEPGQAMTSFLEVGIYLNIFLMFFNMLPVPPLDGSRLLRLFLPEETYLSLATNPLIYFSLIFVTIFFLINYVAIFSLNFTRVLIG